MSGLRRFGPCPTCGAMFESRDRKIFCSMNCYHKSDRFKEIIAKRAAAQRVEDHRTCPHCGEMFITKPSSDRKFCTKLCSRAHSAERHDRWVANPQKIALPQNFDEYLLQDELPCLVEGCHWTGKNLSQHVNFVHGISAAKFKEMVGFNRSTGLVSPEAWRALSDRPYDHLRNDPEKNRQILAAAREKWDGHTSGRRLESRERSRKQLAERRASLPPQTLMCGRCSSPFVVTGAVSKKPKNCPPCRQVLHYEKAMARSVPLTCANCGKEFLGNALQRRRAEKHLPIVCSAECKQLVTKDARTAGRRRSAKRNVPVRGPCHTCGKHFAHYSNLKFCSQDCYHASPEFRARLAARGSDGRMRSIQSLQNQKPL